MTKTRDIKHSRLKQIVDKYRKIQSWLVKHRTVLKILKKDHELLTSEPPYKIHFAVDFHEIFQIVFPLGSKREIKELEDSKKSDWLRQKVVSQLGRICLFYGLETSPVPVLLHAYKNESEDLYLWLKDKKKTDSQPYQQHPDLLKEIQTALREEGIELKKTGKHFEISDEDSEKFIKVMENYFFQLNISLIGGYTEKLSIFKSLFSDKRIEMASDRWSEYSGFMNEEIKKVPVEWFGFIREHRKENQPDIQYKKKDIKRDNSRDLLALHHIKALNKKFKAENKKEIVLLVSDAEIFKDLLNHTLRDDKNNNTIGGVVKTATGDKIEICRTTDVFHTYLLVKKEREELKSLYKQIIINDTISKINKVTLINVEDDLNKLNLIEKFEKEIDRIIEFCNNHKHDCRNLENCPMKDTCLTTEGVIKDFQEDRKSLESLALSETLDIYAKIYKHYQQIVDIDELVKQILEVLQNDEKIPKIINKKLEEIREHFNQGFEELTINSIDKSQSEPNVLKIPRENSFRIKTYDEEIDEIIRKIQRSIRQNNQENFSLHFTTLKFKRKQIDKSKSLEYLLSSLISAAYEQYDLALYFLERGLIFTGNKTRLYGELKYLEAIIYCNDRKYEKALTLCKELLAKFQNDPRLYFFCGYIILTGKYDNEFSHSSIEEAVGYCRNALSIFNKTGDDDSDLNLYILNNLIYGLAKIGTEETLEEAEQYIVELERCSIPEYDWGFHIWHTIGYVFLKKAELLKGKKIDYSEIISEAIKNLEIANKKADGENPIIKRDLKKAKEMNHDGFRDD